MTEFLIGCCGLSGVTQAPQVNEPIYTVHMVEIPHDKDYRFQRI